MAIICFCSIFKTAWRDLVHLPLRSTVRAIRTRIVCAITLACLEAWSQGADRTLALPPPKVLVLFSHDRLLPLNMRIDEGFRTELEKLEGGRVEIFTEFLDVARFPGPERDEALEEYLRKRYANSAPHVLVAVAEAVSNALVTADCESCFRSINT